MTTEKLLTPEQEQTRRAFITKCVDSNAIINWSFRPGVSDKVTVQDLVNMNEESLRKVGKYIETLSIRNAGSRFDEQDKLELPARSGIYAEEWMDFVALQINLVASRRKAEQKAKEIKSLKEQLQELKTPDDRKKEIMDKLMELEPEAQGVIK